MSITKQIAKNLREVNFGGNWTGVNLKDALTGIDWQQATTQVYSFNTVAVLVFHIHYYIDIVIKVLEGGPISGHDKFSFDMPPIQSQQDWEDLCNRSFADAEKIVALIEQLPDTILLENFAGEKYGNYYRNLAGTIEHTHYHLGQIVLIKKILQADIK